MSRFFLLASLLLLGAWGIRQEVVEVASTELDTEKSYLASVIYAVAKAASGAGAEVIVDRKKAGDGAKMPGAGWVTPFLTDIAKETSPPRCVLFIDLGGGSLTGSVHVLESGAYVDGAAGEYKSKDHGEVTVQGLSESDIYGRKGTFNDYSRKSGALLAKHAVVLVKHIKMAHTSLNCATKSSPGDDSLPDKIYIRQTGKIRYVELVEMAHKGWTTMMRTLLSKAFPTIPFDYALLPSGKEALYEGIDFWEEGVVDDFLSFVGGTKPAKNTLMLCQVGSSSTQASTCTSAICNDRSIEAAGHGVLGALPNEDQASRDCSSEFPNQNCFPELVDRIQGVVRDAGIASLGEKPVIALLNAIGYSVKGLFTWCDEKFPEGSSDPLGAVCTGLKAKARGGEAMNPCGLMQLAASMGEFAPDAC